MQKLFSLFLAATLAATTAPLWAQGNTTIESFSKAKKILEQDVYYDHRVTFYCLAEFDSKKNVTLPEGFTTQKHQKRAARVEWEHVVPAENFGRAFVEWREGDPRCVRSSGKSFKGRACAEKVNREFRLMQADLYNLYPAIGAVNAARSNYRYTMLPEAASSFGSCPMKISDSELKTLREAFEQDKLPDAARRVMNAKAGVGWTSGAHTALPVLTTSYGKKADVFTGFIDNTDIANRLKTLVK